MIVTDTFTHDNKEYDLGKVRIMLIRPEKAFLLPIKDLLWVLDFDTPSEDRITSAKHRYPLIVARWKGKWTIVDGLHRLEKYRRLGITKIPVRQVTDDMLQKALVK